MENEVEIDRRLVAISGVSKQFGTVRAVRDVDLDILRGEFFCLLGPSGCGKTTLMRLIAGFENTDAGQIMLDGRDMAGVPPHRRPVNMMFQSYALFPHLNVADNIGFGLKRAGQGRGQVAQQVARMLALVELDGLADRKPGQLSGGQRQRVALARALALEPKLLLLDEPLGALDRRLRQQTQAQLKRIQHQLGTTFVVVTHDPDEALALADRIAVMDKGEVVQTGTPAELYERPSRFSVAGMLGEINGFACDVLRMADGHAVIAQLAMPFVTDHVPVRANVALGRATLAVRPEHVHLSHAAASEADGRIADVVYQGASLRICVQLAEGRQIVSTMARSQISAASGQPVRVTIDPHNLMVLPS